MFWNSDIYTKLENKTLGFLLSPPKITLFQENYCSVTRSTKTLIFCLAENLFPHSQNCMKPYRKSNLTDETIFFAYSLYRNRRIAENVFWISISRFGVVANKATLTPDKALMVAMASYSVHNLMILNPQRVLLMKLLWIIVSRKMIWKFFVQQYNWSGDSNRGKTKFKCWKYSTYSNITRACHWRRACMSFGI